MTSLYDVFTATVKVKQIKLDYVKDCSLNSQILFIYGNEADINLNSFLNALEDYPLLRKRIDYATFIGKRRWDLFFKEGVLIKLPMGDVSDALLELDQHLKDYNLIEKGHKKIDLRVKGEISTDRIFKNNQ